MSFTDDLLTGLAKDTARIDGCTWSPDTAAGNIYLGPIPDATDSGVGLTPYGLQADTTLADATQPVQFWIRGTDEFVKQVADALFDRHHGATHRIIGGVDVTTSALNSDALMGVDGKGRRERAVNYYFSVIAPTTYRPD